MFSDCNNLKLATNNEKISGKFLNIQKLNNTLVKNPIAQKYLNKFTIFNLINTNAQKNFVRFSRNNG